MQCCGSGRFIPDPDFFQSRIPNPTTSQKRSVKFLLLFTFTFFCNHKFHKTKKLNYLWIGTEKILSQLTKLKIFSQKIFLSRSKRIMCWGSGSRSQKTTWFRIPDPQKCLNVLTLEDILVEGHVRRTAEGYQCLDCGFLSAHLYNTRYDVVCEVSGSDCKFL